MVNLLKKRHQTSIALESLDDLYFLGRQLEVENFKVCFDAVLGHRLRNNDVVALDLVTDENLAGCLTLLCGDFLNLKNNGKIILVNKLTRLLYVLPWAPRESLDHPPWPMDDWGYPMDCMR